MGTLTDAYPLPYQPSKEMPVIPAARPRRTLLGAMALAAGLAAVPAIASAHVELVSSTPSAGENVDQPPAEVFLEFDGELDPTASTFTVLDHHGEQVGAGGVDLDVADRNRMSGAVAITQPGVYTVEYAVLGVDGHEIDGSFSFGYATDAEIPEGEDGHDHESSNTALPAQTLPAQTLPSEAPRPLTGVGLILLALAAATTARRAFVR